MYTYNISGIKYMLITDSHHLPKIIGYFHVDLFNVVSEDYSVKATPILSANSDYYEH